MSFDKRSNECTVNRTSLSFLFLIAGPMAEVKAVVKGTARLPCDLAPPVANDSVILVIWYKNDITPIYR